jgi:hypothetical protein
MDNTLNHQEETVNKDCAAILVLNTGVKKGLVLALCSSP